MKSSLLQRIKSRVQELHALPPKSTSKEQQNSFGILKSSDDALEPPKKDKKHNSKVVFLYQDKPKAKK